MWFGAIYYQMIEHKVSNNKIYTLLVGMLKWALAAKSNRYSFL